MTFFTCIFEGLFTYPERCGYWGVSRSVNPNTACPPSPDSKSYLSSVTSAIKSFFGGLEILGSVPKYILLQGWPTPPRFWQSRGHLRAHYHLPTQSSDPVPSLFFDSELLHSFFVLFKLFFVSLDALMSKLKALEKLLCWI